MKKTLKKIIFSILLLSSSLVAEPGVNFFNNIMSINGLSPIVGLEGGYSNLDYEKTDNDVSIYKETLNLNHLGVKVGTEAKSYRVFFSTRIFDVDEFDRIRTYGMEFQYLFNYSKKSSMFIGVNTGTIDMKFDDRNNHNTITLDDTYIGGDIGFNLHINRNFDFEIGARFISFNSSTSDGTVKYDFDNIVTGYASIILKFPMDL